MNNINNKANVKSIPRDIRYPKFDEVLSKSFSELNMKEFRVGLSPVLHPITSLISRESPELKSAYTDQEIAFIKNYKIQTRLDIELLINGGYGIRGFMNRADFNSAIAAGKMPIIASLASIAAENPSAIISAVKEKSNDYTHNSVVISFTLGIKLISNFRLELWEMPKEEFISAISGLAIGYSPRVLAECFAPDSSVIQFVSGVLTKHNHVFNGISPRAFKLKYQKDKKKIYFEISEENINKITSNEFTISEFIKSVESSKTELLIACYSPDFTTVSKSKELATLATSRGYKYEEVPIPLHFPKEQKNEILANYGFDGIVIFNT